MIDRGSGPAVVLIPGIQGRWEWMAPAVNALATRCRVITGSLEEPSEKSRANEASAESDFDIYTRWVDELLDRVGLDRAAICGVSYGGYVALHYAAERPARVTSLTLASAPSPSYRPTCRVEWYLKAPRLLSPVFALSAPVRLYPEIAVAFPNLLVRAVFALRHLHRVTRYPFEPTRMAQRMRLLDGVDFAGDCGRVRAPTLVVTGDRELDRVVPVESTREYVRAIPGATYTRLEGTGHIGLVTKPQRFADVVGGFVATHAARATDKVTPGIGQVKATAGHGFSRASDATALQH